MAPKSLPHKITVPGLSALFGNRELPSPEGKAPLPESVPAPAPLAAAPEPPVPAGQGSSTPAALPAPTLDLHPAPSAPSPAFPPLPVAPLAKATPIRKMSKAVRVTQPEVDGKPKGRHTLVIDEAVLEELSLLAWAENMSVSAIAREAFDAYLGTRRKAVLQARELRDSFGRKREAV